MINKMLTIALFLISMNLMAQEAYTIKGNIENLKHDATIYLVYNTGGELVTDSTLVQNGVFTFNGEVAYPVLATVFLHKNPYVQKIDKGEHVDHFRFYLAPSTMYMFSADSLSNLIIEGSLINDQYAKQQAMQKAINQKFDDLNKEFYALPPSDQADSSVLAHFQEREHAVLNESYSAHIDFAEQTPNSYLSLISLSYVAGQPQFKHRTEKVFETISEQLRDTPLGKELCMQIAAIDSIEIGNIAPDLTLKTLTGDTVAISDYRGKYLLIDFWASWCGPCREENPNLVKAYNRYKKYNFEILGISLDNPNQKDEWIKAIEMDSLQWTQVCDFLSWNSLAAKIYGVNSIPSNFLLDPEGRIVAKNIRGTAALKILNELFVSTNK